MLYVHTVKISIDMDRMEHEKIAVVGSWGDFFFFNLTK